MKRRFPTYGPLIDRRRFLGSAGTAVAATAFSNIATAEASAASTIRRSAATSQFLSPVLEVPPAAGAWIELSGSAIAANVEAIRRAAGGRPIMGVVKANAYGHGLVPMARELTRAGVESLMVITVDEALAIRDAGIDVPVLNYGPFDRGAADELVRRGVDQAVYTVAAVEQMVEAGRRVDRPPRLQVIFDTGLGRVGAPERQAAGLFAEVARLQGDSDMTITGVATALTEDPEYDRVQLGRYNRLCAAAGNSGVDVGTRHVASSAAILDFPESHLDMVRPGIMLYGHYPNDRSMRERPIELTPVLSLKAKVAYVKTLQRGDSVGYHRAWVAERETTVATLPIGHSEGYPAGALAAGGAVEIDGRACPLVGGITSNHLEVAIPEGASVEIGDVATLIAGGATELAGAGQPPGTEQTAAGADRPGGTGSAPWLPTAQQVGRWDGAGVYGTLMHLSPLLPRLIT